MRSPWKKKGQEEERQLQAAAAQRKKRRLLTTALTAAPHRTPACRRPRPPFRPPTARTSIIFSGPASDLRARG